MPPVPSPSAPDVELLRLQERRTELDQVIRLLEEIMKMRLKRPPEVTAFLSSVRRRPDRAGWRHPL